MAEWIKTEDRLPKDGQLVLIETNRTNVFYHNERGQEALKRHHVAVFRQGGIPKPGEKSYWADQKPGYNLVPYRWDGDGPCNWFGQDVVRWMQIPE